MAAATAPPAAPHALLFEDNASSIGNTPLIRLTRLVPAAAVAKVYAKVEGRNPAYSVKCRIGFSMVDDALKSGALKAGMTIIEPTSGNTGIALAAVGAAKGFKVTLVMPESFSVERRKVLKAFGATVLLTERTKGMPGAIAKAKEIAASDPSKYWIPMQFDNPSNPAIHEATTGPEIYSALQGHVGAVIAGVGTGGTITGITRYLKSPEKLGPKGVVSVAVEPAESPVLTQTRAGQKPTPAPHQIQGIGAGFVPSILDLSIIDRIETVTSPEALTTARRLAVEEGILSGVSSGAAVAAALRLAVLPEFKDKNIVAILPDSGERYLSSALFDGIFPGIAEAKAGDAL